MASMTRSFVFWLIFGLLFITMETVAGVTPTLFAISFIVTLILSPYLSNFTSGILAPYLKIILQHKILTAHVAGLKITGTPGAPAQPAPAAVAVVAVAAGTVAVSAARCPNPTGKSL